MAHTHFDPAAGQQSCEIWIQHSRKEPATLPPKRYRSGIRLVLSKPNTRNAFSKPSRRIDLEKVNEAIVWFREARDAGRRIFVCGNGGSSATASHFAADMFKGSSHNGTNRFRILALTDSVPTLTAYSNDLGYDDDVVFVEQLRNFAEPGDILMAISGFGNSPNVLRAVEYANSIECRTIALTGRNGGKLGPSRPAQHSGRRTAHGPDRRCPLDRVPYDLLLLYEH